MRVATAEGDSRGGRWMSIAEGSSVHENVTKAGRGLKLEGSTGIKDFTVAGGSLLQDRGVLLGKKDLNLVRILQLIGGSTGARCPTVENSTEVVHRLQV